MESARERFDLHRLCLKETVIVPTFGRALNFGRGELELLAAHELERAGKPAAEHVAGLPLALDREHGMTDLHPRTPGLRIHRLDTELAPAALREALHVMVEDLDALEAMR